MFAVSGVHDYFRRIATQQGRGEDIVSDGDRGTAARATALKG
jgi:hypothetical protein